MSIKTLVIGASTNQERYSYKAIQMLVAYKHPVLAYGLRSGEVAGVTIATELISYTDVHTVTMYINPSRQNDLFDYIISLNPKRVIFNPGTENPEFYQQLTNHGIDFEEACTLVLLRANLYDL